MSEKWIKVIETTKEDKILDYLKKEFDESNIKYKFELKEKWEGAKMPKYIGNIVLYVQDTFENEAQEILNRHYENNETVMEETEKIPENDERQEDEIEIESKERTKKQKIAMIIYMGIVICMIISFIIAGLLA